MTNQKERNLAGVGEQERGNGIVAFRRVSRGNGLPIWIKH